MPRDPTANKIEPTIWIFPWPSDVAQVFLPSKSPFFSPTMRFNSNLLNESNIGRARLPPSRGGPSHSQSTRSKPIGPSAGPTLLPSRRHSKSRLLPERGRLVRTAVQIKPAPQVITRLTLSATDGSLRFRRISNLTDSLAAACCRPGPPTRRDGRSGRFTPLEVKRSTVARWPVHGHRHRLQLRFCCE